MSARVYYNEIEPYCAAWLRNLMDAGHIPAGDIDTRSIEDVIPDELRGYDQCHFFAGLGGWAYALQLAGWGDRPVWTGSCPCQPFSSAGKGAGFEDERHLWPTWQHLIAQRRPAVVFGEQVASKDTGPWIDLVHADLEGMGYAFGCVPFPAAGIGAPHIRDRNYWVADADHARLEGWRVHSERADQLTARSRGMAGRLADSVQPGRPEGWALAGSGSLAGSRIVGWLADAELHAGCAEHVDESRRWFKSPAYAAEPGRDGAQCGPGPLHGFWADADWLLCTDGKWRPVEPGTCPLVDGIPGRVGRLRAYGNAIVPEEAAEFVGAYLDVCGARAAEQGGLRRMSLFQHRPDAEYRQCTRCAELGYGEDSWHPATSEFWPLDHGRIRFVRCLACASELAARRTGFVPNTEAA